MIERAKRAKATLGGAEASEASQVGEASEASEPTCNHTLYIGSERGLIIRTELIYKYTIYKRPIPIQELRAEEGGGLIIHHGLIIRILYGTCSIISLHRSCPCMSI